MNLFTEILQLQKEGTICALCTIVYTKGSTPRKMGAKMLVKPNREIIGTIGGGDLEKKVIENALHQIDLKEAKLFKHDLLHQHNMCCGGTVEIYIEPIFPMKKLYIFGAGHTGKALAHFANQLNFEIYVIDDRKDYLGELPQLKNVNKLHADYKKVLPTLPFDKNTYVVILTYEHEIDRDILSYCINQPHAYIGMIGSQRKIEITKKMFLNASICNQEKLDTINMPIGIDISAESPEEIAISILAKLIELKNG